MVKLAFVALQSGVVPAPAGYQLFTIVHIDGDNIVWTSPYGTALSAGVTLRPTVEKWLREFPVDQLS